MSNLSTASPPNWAGGRWAKYQCVILCWSVLLIGIVPTAVVELIGVIVVLDAVVTGAFVLTVCFKVAFVCWAVDNWVGVCIATVVCVAGNNEVHLLLAVWGMQYRVEFPGFVSLAFLHTPSIKQVFACKILQQYGMKCQKTYLRTSTPSEDSDQTAHSRSLIRIFAWRNLNRQGCKFHLHNDHSDQTARGCSS